MDAIVFTTMSYAYPRKEAVLTNINLKIAKGSFAVLTGPEGAGKTTICLAIAGAVPGYFGGRMAGSVTVGGVQTTTVTVADLARQVGMVLADYDSQLVALTVAEEVAFGLENRGECPEQIVGKVRQVLSLVGLSGKEAVEVATLSGGQRQRLAIASMLVTEPEILVLDEPTSALDPEGAAELYCLLGELNKEHGKTVVVVEHNLVNVLDYANQLIVLDRGQVVLSGQPQAVLVQMAEQDVYSEAVPEIVKAQVLDKQAARKEVAKIA